MGRTRDVGVPRRPRTPVHPVGHATWGPMRPCSPAWTAPPPCAPSARESVDIGTRNPLARSRRPPLPTRRHPLPPPDTDRNAFSARLKFLSSGRCSRRAHRHCRKSLHSSRLSRPSKNSILINERVTRAGMHLFAISLERESGAAQRDGNCGPTPCCGPIRCCGPTRWRLRTASRSTPGSSTSRVLTGWTSRATSASTTCTCPSRRATDPQCACPRGLFFSRPSSRSVGIGSINRLFGPR